MFIDSLSEEDLENLEIDELTDIKLIISLAVKVYENSRENIVQIQNLFKKFVDFLYGYNNSQALNRNFMFSMNKIIKI